MNWEIEAEIVAILEGEAEVTERVEDRIYPLVAEQSAPFPRITFALIATEAVTSYSGYSGVEAATIQVTSWGSTFASAKELSAAVRNALEDYSGVAVALQIQHVFFELEAHQYEFDAGSADKHVWSIAQDYLVWYEEPSGTGSGS